MRSVPVSEQRLYQFTKDDQTRRIWLVRPQDPTPVLDHPIIALDAPEHHTEAVRRFLEYVRAPERMQKFADLGYRGAGRLPAATATVDFVPIGATMPTLDPAASIAVNRIVLPAAAPRRAAG